MATERQCLLHFLMCLVVCRGLHVMLVYSIVTTLHYTTLLASLRQSLLIVVHLLHLNLSLHIHSALSLSLSLFSVVCNPLVYFVLSFFLLPLVTNKQQHCVVSLLPGHSYSTCIWPIYTTPCTATHSLRHTLHAEEHHPGLFSC